MKTNPPPSRRAPSARMGDDGGSLRGSIGRARTVGSEAWKPRLGVGFLFDRWWWAVPVQVPRWMLALLVLSWASLVAAAFLGGERPILLVLMWRLIHG